MKTLIYSFGLSLLTLAAVSCDNTSSEKDPEADLPEVGIPESFDYGKVENDVYRNKYFKCSMRIPKEWKVQTKETLDELTADASERVAGDDEQLKQAIEAGQISTANLLAVSKLDMQTALEPNPNFLILAENISRGGSAVSDGADYLKMAKVMMERTEINYSYISEQSKKEPINGEPFYRMDAGISNGILEAKQTYLCTIRKGFAFVIIITYFNDEQKAYIDEYIRTLKFEKEDA